MRSFVFSSKLKWSCKGNLGNGLGVGRFGEMIEVLEIILGDGLDKDRGGGTLGFR